MAVASRTSMTVRCTICGNLGTHLNGPHCLHCRALLPAPGTPTRPLASANVAPPRRASPQAAVEVTADARPAPAPPAPLVWPTTERQLPRYGPPASAAHTRTAAQPATPAASRPRMIVGPAPVAPRNPYAGTALVYGVISTVIAGGAGLLGYYAFGLLSLYALYYGIRGAAVGMQLRGHAGLFPSLAGLVLSGSALVLTALVATGVVPLMVSW